MKLTRSFRTRLFVGFLLASLLPLLLCSAMLLQIFRLQMEAQADSESDVQLIHVTTALDGLYDGFRQTSLALKASPYAPPSSRLPRTLPPPMARMRAIWSSP